MIKKTVKKLVRKKIAEPVLNISYSFLILPSSLRKKGRTLFDAQELKLLHKALLSQNLISIGGEMMPALSGSLPQPMMSPMLWLLPQELLPFILFCVH